MAKQDKELKDLANSIGGMGRAHVKRQAGAQRPIATAQQTGATTPKAHPVVSQAKAMDTFKNSDKFLDRYKPAPKPKAAPRAPKTTAKKASRGR